MTDQDTAVLLSLLFVAIVYFFPALLAGGRKHHQTGAIAVLNLLLGWTIIGWVVALVWAATAVRRDPAGSADSSPR